MRLPPRARSRSRLASTTGSPVGKPGERLVAHPEPCDPEGRDEPDRGGGHEDGPRVDDPRAPDLLQQPVEQVPVSAPRPRRGERDEGEEGGQEEDREEERDRDADGSGDPEVADRLEPGQGEGPEAGPRGEAGPQDRGAGVGERRDDRLLGAGPLGPEPVDHDQHVDRVADADDQQERGEHLGRRADGDPQGRHRAERREDGEAGHAQGERDPDRGAEGEGEEPRHAHQGREGEHPAVPQGPDGELVGEGGAAGDPEREAGSAVALHHLPDRGDERRDLAGVEEVVGRARARGGRRAEEPPSVDAAVGAGGPQARIDPDEEGRRPAVPGQEGGPERGGEPDRVMGLVDRGGVHGPGGEEVDDGEALAVVAEAPGVEDRPHVPHEGDALLQVRRGGRGPPPGPRAGTPRRRPSPAPRPARRCRRSSGRTRRPPARRSPGGAAPGSTCRPGGPGAAP